MKKSFLAGVFLMCGAVALVSCAPLDHEVKKAPGTGVLSIGAGQKLIDNFNSGSRVNALGGGYGAWDRDPQDTTQFCKAELNSKVKRGNIGYSMEIQYDVDSPNPAYNGFWTKLNSIDATPYTHLVIWIKGDKKAGFTNIVKLELKNTRGESGYYYIKGIDSEWKEFVVPLKDFRLISDFRSLSELVITFEDRIVSKKTGTIYIDDLYFDKR